MIRYAVFTLLALHLMQTHCLAHRLNVFALREGAGIRVETYFGDGKPLADKTVTVSDSKGRILAEGTTDTEGTALLTSPFADKLTVAVEGSAGHLGRTTLQPAAIATPVKNSGEVAAAVAVATKPLREELERLRMVSSKPGPTQIGGGLGYLAGLCGLYLWWAGRKRAGG